MKSAQELEGDELLDALGVEVEEAETGGYTPKQERILAGFEDVVRFRETHGRAPQHGPALDIFERLYAVRLDQLRKLPEDDLALLRPLDPFGLLKPPADSGEEADALSDDELLAALAEGETDDIGMLVHVQSPEARREAKAAEYIAERVKCEDFDLYKLLFQAAEVELATGQRVAKAFEKDASIEEGDFFILDGQMAYVAAVGETFRTVNADTQGRLRVIYSNATESNILLRSLQRALYEKHRNGRRVTTPDLGPLFGSSMDAADVESGTIYVLRSLSKQPEVVALGDSLHKIGVTGGHVEDRIGNAKNDATYLYAPVEVIATWKLANVNRVRLEGTIHRVFAAAQLQMSLPGTPGRTVQPQEWFVVPLPVINEAVQRISDGSITRFIYDPLAAQLKESL